MIHRRLIHKKVFVLLSVLAPLAAQAQVAANETLRLDTSVASPWGKPLSPAMPAGTPMKVTPTALDGPAPLKCTGANHTFIRTSAEGLFEGNLPAPAEESAKRLGLPEGVITQRISCSNGSFDVHRAPDGRAWIGLDNAVLLWDRTSIAASPEAIVQLLLIQHMSGNMALSRESVASQREWLSARIVEQFDGWFTRTAGNDEVPELNGDPYTDSQESPESFELSAASVKGNEAEVTVTFRDAADARYPVQYLLSRVDGTWRVDDLRYRDGERLSQLLQR
ncbi:hypothetical protein HNQ60_004850 [Povalibacter uvarum]|uniref:DUF3828 domain-containing protein n=1 Tax=Povalibacter uvarum TaxID=732238 RepID=A0A841HUL5_9GAMM|nr:DUF3828 domain-containing protein [Povalibacter uvarum]MBB6095959.1 hypothetical protein [Povalibacter uvarum]